jgi:hypothetical protein
MSTDEDRDPTAEFFRNLAEHGHEPVLARTSGTLRFDVGDGHRTEHWYVTIDKGDVRVSHARSAADAVVRLDKPLSDAILSGRENATACLLRGAFMIEGDLSLLMQFQRLFPGPPARPDVPAAGYARRLR